MRQWERVCLIRIFRRRESIAADGARFLALIVFRCKANPRQPRPSFGSRARRF